MLTGGSTLEVVDRGGRQARSTGDHISFSRMMASIAVQRFAIPTNATAPLTVFTRRLGHGSKASYRISWTRHLLERAAGVVPRAPDTILCSAELRSAPRRGVKTSREPRLPVARRHCGALVGTRFRFAPRPRPPEPGDAGRLGGATATALGAGIPL